MRRLVHDDGLLGLVVLIVTPVGLEEDGVDLLEIDRLGAVSDGFDEGSDTEVLNGPEGALGAADDKVEGGLEFEGVAEQTQDVAPGVEGAVDDGGDPLFGVVGDEVVFEDALSGAGFPEDDAESTLLGVDFEDVEVSLLVGQEGGLAVDDEGVQ